MARRLAVFLLLAILAGAISASACNNASKQIQGSSLTASEETQKEPLIYENVPADRLIVIVPYYPGNGEWPGENMWGVVEPIMAEYELERVYNAPVWFMVSTEKSLSDEEVMKLMEAIAEDDNVWSVYRDPFVYPGVRIDKSVTGPEPMPLGGWEDPSKDNSWVEHDTLQQAEEAVGFTFRIPESDLEKVYRTYERSILEVIFVRDGQELYRLRKGAGYGNISGYPNRALSGQTGGVGGRDWLVPFTQIGRLQTDNSGESTGYNIAARYYRDYSYSFTSEEELTDLEMFIFFIDDKNQNEKTNLEIKESLEGS